VYRLSYRIVSKEAQAVLKRALAPYAFRSVQQAVNI
jgi:hypothetical protein